MPRTHGPLRPAPALVEAPRIAVIVTRQIGDVLLTTPLIQAAHERWPQAQIDVIGFAGTLGMLEGNPAVSARIELAPRLGWRAALAIGRQLWRRYDLALIAEASDRAHLIGWIAGRCRAGLVPAQASHAWWKAPLLVHAVTVAGDRSTRHVAAEKLALMAPWRTDGAAARVVPPPPRPLPQDIECVLGSAAIVVHAPSMWPYKQWPIAHYAEVVRALLTHGRQVVLTGAGPVDARLLAPLAALAEPPRLINACSRLDFGQLACLLGRAALYIGPDTSVTHLAAAVGVPVVTVFGPTNPARWGPICEVPEGDSKTPGAAARPEQRPAHTPERRARRVILLQGPNACVPCSQAGCDDHRESASLCLQAIGAERVLTAAAAILTDVSAPAAIAAQPAR